MKDPVYIKKFSQFFADTLDESALDEHSGMNRSERIAAHKRLKAKHHAEGNERLEKMYDDKIARDVNEAGLWDNIHAKRERIKNGSGERMRRPGEKGRPTAADFKAAQEETMIEGRILASDYTATSEKSQFGGHRPHVVDKNGRTMYLGQHAYKSPEMAAKHAEAYLSAYANRGPNGADNASREFAKINKRDLFEEEYIEEGPKDAAGRDIFVKKIAKSAGVDYKAAGAIAAAAGRKRLGKKEFQRRVEAGQKAAAKDRAQGKKYDGDPS